MYIYAYICIYLGFIVVVRVAGVEWGEGAIARFALLAVLWLWCFPCRALLAVFSVLCCALLSVLALLCLLCMLVELCFVCCASFAALAILYLLACVLALLPVRAVLPPCAFVKCPYASVMHQYKPTRIHKRLSRIHMSIFDTCSLARS